MLPLSWTGLVCFYDMEYEDLDTYNRTPYMIRWLILTITKTSTNSPIFSIIPAVTIILTTLTTEIKSGKA